QGAVSRWRRPADDCRAGARAAAGRLARDDDVRRQRRDVARRLPGDGSSDRRAVWDAGARARRVRRRHRAGRRRARGARGGRGRAASPGAAVIAELIAPFLEASAWPRLASWRLSHDPLVTHIPASLERPMLEAARAAGVAMA